MARAATVRIRGYKELSRAFTVADKSLKTRWRLERRAIGEPVAALAQSYALSRIPGLTQSPSWAQMKVGVTTRVVYVAPKGKRRGGSPRPNFGSLLMERAMAPALEASQTSTIRRIEMMLDRMESDWDHA